MLAAARLASRRGRCLMQAAAQSLGMARAFETQSWEAKARKARAGGPGDQCPCCPLLLPLLNLWHHASLSIIRSSPPLPVEKPGNHSGI